MRASLVLVVVCSSAIAHAGAAAEREVATIDLGGKAPVALSLTRQKLADGGLKLKLVITSKDGKGKPRSVVLYEGGADEDGPTDKLFRSGHVEPFALPGDKRGARVDFEFQVPGSKKFHQVDSYVVSLDDAKKVLEVTTRRERKRTKVCQEIEETSLTLDKDGKLFAKPMSSLESELNDDDLPIDKTCHGKQAGQQITYKFDGETFLQIDPPPAPKKKAAEDEDSDD